MARSAMRPKAGFYLGLADSHREATPPVQRSQRQKTIMEALYETPSDGEASDEDETAGERDEASAIVKDAPYPKKLTIVLTDRCNLKCVICQRDEYEQAVGGFGQLLDLNNLSHLDEAIKAAEIIDITGFGESFLHPELKGFLDYIYFRDDLKQITIGFNFRPVEKTVFKISFTFVDSEVVGFVSGSADRFVISWATYF